MADPIQRVKFPDAPIDSRPVLPAQFSAPKRDTKPALIKTPPEKPIGLQVLEAVWKLQREREEAQDAAR